MISIKNLKDLAQDYSVLYVEDEEQIRKSVLHYLQSFFATVDGAVDGEEGLSLYQSHKYDLVITDISMPKMNGLKMAAKIKEINEKQEILIISAYAENNFFMESIRIGVSGYIAKPIDFKQINEVLYKVLYKLKVFKENELYKTNLEQMVEVKTEEQRDNYEKTLSSLVSMIEQRDTYTGGHSERVAKYSKRIAEAMGYSSQECDLIYRAGILHDIGKIVTPDAILLKPGKLNDLEYKLIQEHVTVGANMLASIPMYNKFADIIVAHHEHYDGSGYPKGLKGEEIPPLARIMVVADAFDAMTTNRIYKVRKSVIEALKELRSLSGIHFFPKVVDAAEKVLSHVDLDKTVSQLPTSDLEKERFAYFYMDSVTSLYNSSYLDLLLSKNTVNNKYSQLSMIFLHNFADYNKLYGWKEGDKILKKCADVLKKSFPERTLFRIHGDDFVLLGKNTDKVDKKINDLEVLFESIVITYSTQELDIQENNINSLSTFEKIILL